MGCAEVLEGHPRQVDSGELGVLPEGGGEVEGALLADEVPCQVKHLQRLVYLQPNTPKTSGYGTDASLKFRSKMPFWGRSNGIDPDYIHVHPH